MEVGDWVTPTSPIHQGNFSINAGRVGQIKELYGEIAIDVAFSERALNKPCGGPRKDEFPLMFFFDKKRCPSGHEEMLVDNLRKV